MVYTENREFEWDPQKAASNFQKHSVTFEEAIFAFFDSVALSLPDPKHSMTEERRILIGAVGPNLFVISYTKRNFDKTRRVISARKANEKEKKKYREN